MDVRLKSAKERVEYADAHGDDAACEHYCIQLESLKRCRRRVAIAEQDETYSEYRIIFDKITPKKWTDYPRLYGDWLILNDLHIPFINTELMDKALKAADLLGLKQLAVLGDLVDFEAASKFDFGGEQYTLMEELEIARDYLKAMEKEFDRIVFIRGNHDERCLKFLKRIKKIFESNATDDEADAYHAIIGVNVSQTPWHQYKAFFESPKVEVSNYAKCEFEGKFVGLHPSNYSRVPPAVERKMCNKYLKHVIGTHAHLSAIGFHDSGQFIAAQLGGMVDEELVFYKNHRETNHPEWVGGFGWIHNKKFGYYFDHPDLMSAMDYMEIGKAARTLEMKET